MNSVEAIIITLHYPIFVWENGLWIDMFRLLTVGPKTVTVTGPSEAKVNDTVSLECSTTNSNPVARITWVLDGREVRENGSRIATSPDGGWVSSSNLTYTIRATGRNVTVSCHAIVADLAQRVAETKIISVVCKFPSNSAAP
jgi:CD80-like C2-set immunoglobulin domain